MVATIRLGLGLLLVVVMLNGCSQLGDGSNTPPSRPSPTVSDDGLFAFAGNIPSNPTDPTIIRSRMVKLNLDLLGKPSGNQSEGLATRVKLNLFPDAIFVAQVERADVSGPGQFTWVGRIDGQKYSEVILVVDNAIVAGNVRVGTLAYQVSFVGEGLHVITEGNWKAFPPDDPPSTPKR